MGQIAKVVFCVESASTLCGTAFDHPDEAIKLSGLSKKEYDRQKKTFDKLLGLTRQLQLKDICLKFELPQSVQLNAQRLLKAYESSGKFTDDIQSAHCQAMAVYECCKQQKIKSMKSKLSTLSGLDTGQWKRLEEQWDKWIVSAEPFKEQRVPLTNDENERNGDGLHVAQTDSASSTKKTDETKIQSYEEWKAAMIAKAMAEIKRQNDTSQNEITVEWFSQIAIHLHSSYRSNSNNNTNNLYWTVCLMYLVLATCTTYSNFHFD